MSLLRGIITVDCDIDEARGKLIFFCELYSFLAAVCLLLPVPISVITMVADTLFPCTFILAKRVLVHTTEAILN